MRIIGGRFRGKKLQGPIGRAIRPTSDRVRESLFNILDHRGLVDGSRFLDLFCGTGAVGLEAYSRGAVDVWLMDQDTRLAEANLRHFDDPSTLRLRHQRTLLPNKAPQMFDLVFLDPPYRRQLVEETLQVLRTGWLAPDGRLVAEIATKDNVTLPNGYRVEDDRRYGGVRLLFLAYGPAKT